MTPELQQIIDQTMRLTGAAAPALLDADAPVLQVDANADQPLYLVGLIGGKEVGKSSLINALVGQTISEQSAHGAGTELAIAYAHHTGAEELKAMLDRAVPGKYRIVPHDVADLSRQVLVDLPDIDSHWAEHVALTRKMLRHLLYPLWIQSIEKYADIQPQKLLAQVAAGNDPSNFVFCLNKADQLREGDSAAEELRSDYAARLKKTLGLPSSPRVYLISAQQPQSRDLPAMRSMLSNQKSTAIVRQSIQLAGNRQDRSLIKWIDAQQLGPRADSAHRLLNDAEELLAARVAGPLLEAQLPRLAEDAGYQLSIIEPAVSRRLSHWPIVNIVHSALLPMTLLVRKNIETIGGTSGIGAPAIGPVFALLNQSHPLIAQLYARRKLWEDLPADEAQADLRGRLNETLARQSEEAIVRAASPSGLLSPFRWLLTLGALIWFPIAQPIVEAMLAPGWTGLSRDFLLLAVQILSAAYLLKSIGFLMIYFLCLWALLRWQTRRRVLRLLQDWSREDADPALSLPAQSLQWMNELLTPLRRHEATIRELVGEVEKARASILEPPTLTDATRKRAC
jgi:hypothetical protein